VEVERKYLLKRIVVIMQCDTHAMVQHHQRVARLMGASVLSQILLIV